MAARHALAHRLGAWILVGALGAGLALPTLAQKQPASLGGPSVIKVSEVATVSGSGLPINAAVTVVVTAPGGANASFGAVTDAEGRLEHRVAATAAGRWKVAVLDSGGRQLAVTRISFLP